MRYCSQCAHLSSVSSRLRLLAFAGPAAATRQVRVFETNVSSQTDPAVQAQAALRVVLVRATGARDAANDPALAGVLAQAQTYVIATRPAATGSGTTLVFDAAALERDIVAAGRTVWSSERPAAAHRAHGRPRHGRLRNAPPGRRCARCRRQSPRPADHASRAPKALNLPTTGDIPVEAALAAAQRLRRRRSAGGLRRRGAQWWRLALDAERAGRQRIVERHARRGRAWRGRRIRAQCRDRTRRSPSSPSWSKSKACPRSRNTRAPRRCSAKPRPCAACSSPKRPDRARRFRW